MIWEVNNISELIKLMWFKQLNAKELNTHAPVIKKNQKTKINSKAPFTQ